MSLRARVTVRSDSVSALTVLLSLKARGVGPLIVARELALTFAEATYNPVIGEHISGISNITCDILSRPNVNRDLPAVLKQAVVTQPADISADCYEYWSEDKKRAYSCSCSQATA